VRWMLRTSRKEYINAFEEMRPVYSGIGGLNASPIASVPGKSEIRRTAIDRQPYNGSLVPALEFHLPRYGTQVANVAALLWSKRELKSYYS